MRNIRSCAVAVFCALAATQGLARVVSFAPAANFSVGTDPDTVVVGDFNRDGYGDLAVTNVLDSSISVLLGDGAGGFGGRADIAVGSFPVGAAVADFDGDGATDVAVNNFGSNSISVLLGDGSGAFPNQVEWPLGGPPWALVAADFNEDGAADLAAGLRNGTLALLLGNGSGGFDAPVAIPGMSTPFRLVATDLNGDRHLDLTVPNFGFRNLAILLGAGDGTFSAPQYIPLAGPPRSVAVGDFNTDGVPDIAAAYGNPAGAIIVLHGDGSGTFTPGVSFAIGLGPDGLSTADFDGDGALDLVVANNDDTCLCITVYEGSGTGSFAPGVNYRTGSSSSAIAIADFNLDGGLDLVTANANNNNVSVLMNSAAPTSADVAVTNTVSPATGISPDGRLTYTVTVHNRGPLDATEVAVTDQLPSGVNLDYVTLAATQGGCIRDAAVVTCALGTIAASASVTVTILVHPLTAGLKTNTATVRSRESDPLIANNTAAVTSTNLEVALTDLTVALTATPDPVLLGTGLRYTAQITNLQDDCAANVAASFALPNVSLISVVPAQGTCAGLSCNVGSLCPGGSTTVDLVVIPRVAGSVTATVTVPDRASDPRYNNQASVTTAVYGSLVSIVANDADASEVGLDPGLFNITRSGDTSASLTVGISIAGTATLGQDYLLLGGNATSVVIPAGQTTAALSVSPIHDSRFEGSETVVVTLSYADRYGIGQPSATVVIADTLRVPVVSVTAPDPNAAELGRDPGSVVVSRLGATVAPLTVRFALGGTATWRDDYELLPSPSAITIPAGRDSVSLTVVPADETRALEEGPETVVIELAPAPEYDLGAHATATVTIADNGRLPTVTIAASSDAHESGRQPGTFTITRIGVMTERLDVAFEIGGTATADDYDALPAITTLVSLPRGVASIPITIIPRDDGAVEGTETLTLTLLPRDNYHLAAIASATLTIAEPSLIPVVTITVEDGDAAEPQPHRHANPAAFTVTRTGGDLTRGFVVELLRTGTATPADYTLVPNIDPTRIRFDPGVQSVRLTLTPRDDANVEGPETMNLTAIDGRDYDLGTRHAAVVTIADSDSTPVVTIVATDDVASEDLRANDRAIFTLTRTGDLSRESSVSFRRAGTAETRDYTLLRGAQGDRIPFARFEESVQVVVTASEDRQDEAEETVTLILIDGSGYVVGGAASATIAIHDRRSRSDVPAISLTADRAQIVEPGAARRREDATKITITRIGSIAEALSVSLLITGTARTGLDYRLTDGAREAGNSVKIPGGQQSISLELTATEDREVEGTETVHLMLAAAPGYVVGLESSTTVAIIDNDSAPIATVTATPAELNEGDGHNGRAGFTITRFGDLSAEVKIHFMRVGTARHGEDYRLRMRIIADSVSLPATVPSATVLLEALDDRVSDPGETITLVLLPGSGYTLGSPASATITITEVLSSPTGLRR